MPACLPASLLTSATRACFGLIALRDNLLGYACTCGSLVQRSKLSRRVEVRGAGGAMVVRFQRRKILTVACIALGI